MTTPTPTKIRKAPAANPPRFLGRRINLLYLPALALVGFFSIYPLVSGLTMSVTNWDGYSPGSAFVGASNYLRLLVTVTSSPPCGTP